MHDPQAAPSRPPQSRAGNAMERGRGAAVSGARRVLAEVGVRKATMAEVAVRGGLAKATLYNHVRTKEELLLLVVGDGVGRVMGAAAPALQRGDLAAALAAAAAALADDEVLVGLRRVEPGALVALLCLDDGPGWSPAREAVAAALDRADRASGPAAVDLVLRWLVSYLLAPGNAARRAASAELLARGVPVATRRTSFVESAAVPPP